MFFVEFEGKTSTGTFNEVTENTYAFTQKAWYHFVLDVNGTSRTVKYSISPKGETTVVATGTYTVPEGESLNCKGFYERNNRYNYDPGAICIDNVDIYTMVDGIVANDPKIELTSVNGSERTYTIEYSDGETLYYQLPGQTEYISVNDGTTVSVTATVSGTLSAYTVRGTAQSNTVSTEVEAINITLNAPTYRFSDISTGYSKSYTINIDNSSIILTPTATLSYVFTPKDGTAQSAVTIANGGVISSNEAGEYVITASAEGYTSSTLTITNDIAYAISKEYKFNEMTDADFSDTNLWTTGTDGDTKWGWSADAPATKYTLIDPATNATTAIEGIELFTNKEPTFYIGYGLMFPYGGSNTASVKIKNAVEGQIAKYTTSNNYGKNTNITIDAASNGYWLYRYSDMLKNITIYSPTITKTIPASGYASFSATSNAVVPEGVTVFKANMNGDNTAVLLSPVETSIIPANTGVILKAEAGDYSFTLTNDAADAIADNALIATTVQPVVPADGTYAALSASAAEFGKLTAGMTLSAGKAYLAVPETAGAKLAVVFDNATGANVVEVEGAEAQNAAAFNLAGQRVSGNAKGIVIINGKKYIK